MESQPQNPEFRNDPENSHSCGFISLQSSYHNTGYLSRVIYFVTYLDVELCYRSIKYSSYSRKKPPH